MKNINYTELNERAFDFLAERYSKRKEKLDGSFAENFSSYLIDNFANSSILEIGCGSGSLLKYFSGRNFKTTAIDISSEIIRNAKIVSPTTDFIHSDFLGYDFGDERFSGIVAKNILHLFPMSKITNAFDKVYSLLDNMGIFYFSTPLFDESSEEIISRREKSSVLEFRTRYAQSDIEQILEDSGFGTTGKEVMQFRDSKGNNLSRLNALLIK